MKKFFKAILLAFKALKFASKSDERANIIRSVVDGAPFDFSYCEDIIKAKLVEMREYFKTCNIAYGDEEVAKEIDLALKILNIIENETDYFHFEDRHPELPRTMEHWEDHHTYVCDVNVNLRNIGRFVPDNLIPYYTKFAADAYVLKARHLFYKMLNERGIVWSN